MADTLQLLNSGEMGRVPYGDDTSITEKIVLSKPGYTSRFGGESHETCCVDGDFHPCCDNHAKRKAVRHDDLCLTAASNHFIDEGKYSLCDVAPRLGAFDAAIMVQPIIIRRRGIA